MENPSPLERVQNLWPQLIIPRNLAYRSVGEDVFCWRLGTGIEDRFAIVGGVGVDAFAAIEKQAGLDRLLDAVTERYGVSLDEVVDGLEQFLLAAIAAGLFAKCGPTHQAVTAHALPVGTGEEPSEEDVLDTMFEKASAAAIPLKAILELTHQCNNRCQHCYLGLSIGVPPRPAMSTSRQIELMEEMAAAGVLELVLSGGEPMLHPEFARLLQRASELHFAIGLLTNGTRLDKDMVELLASVPLDHVRVPIYGLEEYHNRFVRNAHAFQQTWQGILALYARGVPVSATSTLTHENSHDLLEIKWRLDEVGVPFHVGPLVYSTIQHDETPTRHRATHDQLRAMVTGLDIKMRRSRCTAGVSRFRISPDGYLHPCEMLSDICFGNLEQDSFEAVLQSPVRQQWIGRFRSYMQAKDDSGCHECSARPHCVDCVGLSYLESGSFSSRCQQACQFAHTLAYFEECNAMFAELT